MTQVSMSWCKVAKLCRDEVTPNKVVLGEMGRRVVEASSLNVCVLLLCSVLMEKENKIHLDTDYHLVLLPFGKSTGQGLDS